MFFGGYRTREANEKTIDTVAPLAEDATCHWPGTLAFLYVFLVFSAFLHVFPCFSSRFSVSDGFQSLVFLLFWLCF